MRPSPPVELTPAVLAGMAVPSPGEQASKDSRGHVLVVGGSAETAGGVLLAGLAALRVGAGRVRVATVASASPSLMAAMPEGRVIGLPETARGAIDPAGAGRLVELADAADVVLVGTGALDPDATEPLLEALTACDTVVVVDAAAVAGAGRHPEWVRRRAGRAVVIPNDSEIGALGGDAVAASETLGCAVSCRGPDTYVTAPGKPLYRCRGGGVGLATAGSGDVAAGVVAGLVGRGADPLAAAAWGAVLHARAGNRLAATVGPIGYLARELLDELPGAWSGPS